MAKECGKCLGGDGGTSWMRGSWTSPGPPTCEEEGSGPMRLPRGVSSPRTPFPPVLETMDQTLFSKDLCCEGVGWSRRFLQGFPGLIIRIPFCFFLCDCSTYKNSQGMHFTLNSSKPQPWKPTSINTHGPHAVYELPSVGQSRAVKAPS